MGQGESWQCVRRRPSGVRSSLAGQLGQPVGAGGLGAWLYRTATSTAMRWQKEERCEARDRSRVAPGRGRGAGTRRALRGREAAAQPPSERSEEGARRAARGCGDSWPRAAQAARRFGRGGTFGPLSGGRPRHWRDPSARRATAALEGRGAAPRQRGWRCPRRGDPERRSRHGAARAGSGLHRSASVKSALAGTLSPHP